MMSPEKKKRRVSKESVSSKRESGNDDSTSKRQKSVKSADDELQAKKRRNFVTACEQVSFKAYSDYKTRLLLLYLPQCTKTSVCIHQDIKNMNVKEIPPIVAESFMIDIRTNMWSEALEVCVLCCNPTQYLSSNVLKEVVEIMLNAHEDECSEDPVSHLVFKCQNVLMQNFSLHPPCTKKLRQCYLNFLTSPMDLKAKTFTNRKDFEYDKGIVKYCLNRLEYELSNDSKEESIVDMFENIPEEMKQSVKGLHWQKEKFEIYEVLERTERIDRLMAVLETIVEILQFDLAVWQGRYKQNLANHVMRSHRPIMAYILWSDNILYTGTVNSNCRQILRIYVNLIHLQFPQKLINIMTIWVNTVIQMFYVCENNSNSDYPNTGKYCSSFAKEFYKIMSGMPNDSVIRIIDQIKPTFMKHIIGTMHLNKILLTEETCVIKNLIVFITESKWNDYPVCESEVQISRNKFFEPVNVKSILRQLAKVCDEWESLTISNNNERKVYPKMNPNTAAQDLNCSHVVQTLFMTLEAYLNSYNIQNVQETLDSLNMHLADDECHKNILELGSYSVTEHFIKKYRTMYQSLRELVLLIQEKKSQNELPEVFSIFKKIDLLDL